MQNKSSGTENAIFLYIAIVHIGWSCYQVCSNDDPGLIATCFTARSNFVPFGFVWENGKTMDCSL